jgi:DNA polymerase III epsilon subunit-like protein
MRTLIYDTETTGKMNFKVDPAAPNQPYLVQLAALLYEDRELAASINVLCCPTDAQGVVVQIPEEATSVHGITNDRVMTCGLPMKTVGALFNNLMRKADRIVAHNMDFDIRVVSGLYVRSGFPIDSLQMPQRVCTMKASENVLKLPGLYGKYKWPTLDEAYRHLVDPNGFDGAHDALVDTKACAEVLWKLEDAGHIR